VGKTLSVILNLFQELIFSLSQYVKIFVRRADSLKVESQKSKVSKDIKTLDLMTLDK
jgi:hypothetical protein